MEVPDWLLVHTVTVEPQTGTGPYSDQYGPAVPVQCFVNYTRQLVRNQAGAEVVSEATVYTTLDQTPLFPLDSRVTLPDGSVAYVIKSSPHNDGGMGAPQHLEVVL
jgi:hypothetical protein